MAPSRLASELLSLPPILHNSDPSPMSGCSKAPRGLFVLSRVTRIFTGLAISPSPSLRQRPSRYAFPAGRNLPDKGFRYLRTVIVTAAVHRGFSSELCSDESERTPPFNLPALGRRQPLYIALRLCRDLCFCYGRRSPGLQFRAAPPACAGASPFPLTFRHWAGVSPYT